MPPARGAGGGERVLWRTCNQSAVCRTMHRTMQPLGGLRAPSALLHAATLHAATIEGVLTTPKAAACKRGARCPFQRTPPCTPAALSCLLRGACHSVSPAAGASSPAVRWRVRAPP